MSHGRIRRYSSRYVPHKLVTAMLYENAPWLLRRWHPEHPDGFVTVRFRARDLSGRLEVRTRDIYEHMQFLLDTGVLSQYRREGTHCEATFATPARQEVFVPGVG